MSSLRLPSFLGIAAARSGSTWLHRCLAAHPEVCMPTHTKELHFFNRDSNFSRGMHWYAEAFDPSDSTFQLGEVTPSYLASKTAICRIADLLPNVRLIAVLRDPAERAFSSYIHALHHGQVSGHTDMFEANRMLTESKDYIERQKAGFLEHGLYGEQLNFLFSKISPERVLIRLFPQLRDCPQELAHDVYQFIGVDAQFSPKDLDRKINAGKYLKSLSLINQISEYSPKFMRSHIVEVARKLRERFAPPRPELSRAWRKALVEYYYEDICLTEQILKVNLDKWKTV